MSDATTTQSDCADFTALLNQHIGIVRKVATTYCRNAADRADLAQEITTQLWISWPRFDQVRPFTTWMYRIALNVGISHVRKVYRRGYLVPLAEEHHTIPDQGVDHEKNQQRAALDTVIAEMDPLNRGLLLLYLDDLSHGEIGEILGLSESNVGTKIMRLKQRLHAQLA